MPDDYVEEYPQSGERIRGKQTARTVNDNYPGGLPNMVDLSFEVNGNLGVLELLVEYDGNQVHICEIVELQDGKIKSARAYFSVPFEAAQWRVQWVERT